jgi:ABC-type dipeptide/oligopeptide/nickel transport system ATPase subunit
MGPLWKGEEGEAVRQGITATTVSENSRAITDLRGLRLEWSASSRPQVTKSCALWVEHEQVKKSGGEEVPVRGVYLNPASAFEEPVGRLESVQREKRLSAAIALLKKIDAGIVDLRLTTNRTIDVDVGLTTLIPLKLMGGGVTRFLSIALAMLDTRDGAVLVDEIDAGLHASAQDTLWAAVLDWANKLDVQVFATTHSYECVAAFSRAIQPQLFRTDTKLYRVERRDHKFGTTEYTHDMLAESLASGWEVR